MFYTKPQPVLPHDVKILVVEPDQPRLPKPKLKVRLMPESEMDKVNPIPWEFVPENVQPILYKSEPDEIDTLIANMLEEGLDLETAQERIHEFYKSKE